MSDNESVQKVFEKYLKLLYSFGKVILNNLIT